ncbi:MAG: serine hydrolase [Planctomycetota bacterium]
MTPHALAALALLVPSPQEAPSLDGVGSLATLPLAFVEALGDDLKDDADRYRIKIEVAVVREDPAGPKLERYAFDSGPEYFYPASSVKTCAAIAALVRIDRLREEGGVAIDRDTPLRFHPLFAGETVEERDPSHADGGTITVAHDMRKVFLVSDNAAYNRLYELAGNEVVNDVMRDAGLTSCRILHRLSEFRSAADQLRVPQVDFLGPDGAAIASIAERTGSFDETNGELSGISFGTGYTRGGKVVDGPMSFERKNWISIRDLVDLNVMLLRPDIALEGHAGFPLSTDDRAFISEAMASTPGTSTDPVYDRASYPDDYSKFLLPGLLKLREMDELVVQDKVGRAYGFSVTNSYVRDLRTGRSFFLAATIYTNPNGIVGDGVYDYERADRFLADLGESVGRRVLGVR